MKNLTVLFFMLLLVSTVSFAREVKHYTCETLGINNNNEEFKVKLTADTVEVQSKDGKLRSIPAKGRIIVSDKDDNILISRDIFFSESEATRSMHSDAYLMNGYGVNGAVYSFNSKIPFKNKFAFTGVTVDGISLIYRDCEQTE